MLSFTQIIYLGYLTYAVGLSTFMIINNRWENESMKGKDRKINDRKERQSIIQKDIRKKD